MTLEVLFMMLVGVFGLGYARSVAIASISLIVKKAVASSALYLMCLELLLEFDRS